MTDLTLTPPAVVGNAIQLPVTTDPDVLTAEAIAYLQALQPGWVPHEGQLDVAMIEVWARMVATAARVMTTVPLSIFQYLGQQLYGIPPLSGAYATMTVRVTMVDDKGYWIPVGTQVLMQLEPGTNFLFVFQSKVVIPKGTTTADTVLTAAVASSAPNGVAADNLVMVDGLAGVQSVECIDDPQTPSGGADAETQATYLNRLRRELSLLTPRPILATDFATIAINQPGVARAIAIDNYNPETDDAEAPLTITVCPVDTAGEPLRDDVRANLEALLDATRPVNWLIFVIDPTYTPINVTSSITVKHGYSLNAVQAAVEASVTAYLSPQRWGGTVDSQGNLTADWNNQTVVRQLGIAGAIVTVEGVAYADDLEFSAGADSVGVGDVVLPGPVPLTTPGNITITATY